MLKFFKMFITRNRMGAVEKYLASSSDLVQLEHRQKQLARKGIY